MKKYHEDYDDHEDHDDHDDDSSEKELAKLQAELSDLNVSMIDTLKELEDLTLDVFNEGLMDAKTLRAKMDDINRLRSKHAKDVANAEKILKKSLT